MTQDEVRRPTDAIAALAHELANEQRLNAELQRARREFFGEDGQEIGQDAAEHRFAEWFSLERESETLGAIPAGIPPYQQLAEDLQGSIAGLFLVRSVDGVVTVTDMQDDTALELAEQDSLQVGDLLVGRLYPISGERWARSAAAPALRPGRELAEAFVRDLKQLELDRRLYQIELEHLLLRRYTSQRISPAEAAAIPPQAPAVPAAADAPPPLEHLEADLEQLLLSCGNRHSATAISQQLAAAPRPGSLIGPLLDQLAFDTDVDLDRAREILLQIWNAHHASEQAPPTIESEPTSSGPPGETLGERLVRTLDEGLGAQRDVEEVFKQLEEIAGITPEEEDEQDGDDELVDAVLSGSPPSGDVLDDEQDTGDLGPLITEYYWETENQAPSGDPLRLWVELQRNAPLPNTDFETIPAADVMRLLLHVYLRAAPDERAGSVRDTFDELQGFYDWAAEAQELDRREELQSCRGSLLDQLDRLQQASLLLSNDDQPDNAPGLLQIEQTEANGFGARDDDGGHYWVLSDAATVEQLRVGDILLGALRSANGEADADRRLAGMVVVLPLDARSLIE